MEVFQPIWSSIRNLTYDPCPSVEDHAPSKGPALVVPPLGWIHLFPPVELACLHPTPRSIHRIGHLIFHHMRVNQVAPRPRESGPDDVRPKKKQRALSTAGPSNPSTTTPTLPVICDIPPEGFSSDESDEVNYRGNSASNPRPASPPSVNPSAPMVNPPRPALPEENPVPAFAKAGATSTTRGTAVIPPRSSVNHQLRPWMDAEDHELFTFKSDTRARPAWKTIGLRLKRDPEACRIRWQTLKQNMPELNSRTEPEAEAED